MWGLWLVTAILGVSLAQAAKPNKRESDEEIGEKLYLRHCAACHGESAAGDGAASSSLVVPVPNLRGKVLSVDREKWSKIVLYGKGTMPAFDLSMELDDARRVMREMERRSVVASKTESEQGPSPPGVRGSSGARR